MRFWKLHPWKLVVLGSAAALLSWLGWLGWRYADQRRPTLLALNTTTGKLQWVHPLSSSISYSKGTIAGDGKVFLDVCLKTAAQWCGAYELQAFDGQTGSTLWTLQPQGRYDPFRIAWNPAVNVQNNQLYLQLEDELRAIDPATGNQRWARPRRGFNEVRFWRDMGLISRFNALALLDSNSRESRQQHLRTLDPKTGKLLQQMTRSLDKLTSTNNLIAANDRSLFLETSGLVPRDSPKRLFPSGTSTITTYNRKTLKPSFRTSIKGEVDNLQAVGNTLQLHTYGSDYDYAFKTQTSDGRILAVNAGSGQILWQKTRSQLDCRRYGSSWRVDTDTVFLNCSRYPKAPNGKGKEDSRIVALLAETGQVKWQTQISPDRYDDLPAAVSAQQYLTFRTVGTAKAQQTQAIALNRQTGKLLWAFPLHDEDARYVYGFRSVVAAEGDRFFMLDVLPRWQLWLLQGNLNWYVKQLL